jgi:hypothetical protein
VYVAVLHACPEGHPHVLHKSVSVPDDVQSFGFVAEQELIAVPSLHDVGAVLVTVKLFVPVAGS